MKKVYILQQDIKMPTCTVLAGAIFELKGREWIYTDSNSKFGFLPTEVENNPEWFKLKETEKQLSIRQLTWEMNVADSPYYFYLTDETKLEISRENLASLLKGFVTNTAS